MDDVDLLPREVLAEVVLATETKGVNPIMAKALSDAIFDGLERRGYLIAEAADVVDPPDEHLRTLKYIRGKVKDNLENIDSARDMASLTKRLSDISKEIVAVEERVRADAKSTGSRSNSTRTRSKTNGAAGGTSRPATTGSLNILAHRACQEGRHSRGNSRDRLGARG